MIASFERDLTENCEEAADFLRKKLSEWRNEISIKNEVYSGEREFVSEVYRLLIEKNGCYRDALFVDYFPYPRGNEQGENIVRLSNDEKKNERSLPDLVFTDRPNNINVVEFDVIVNRGRKGNFRLRKDDIKKLRNDFIKLNKYNNRFKSKFLVVAYTGDLEYKDGTKFPLDLFKEKVHREFGKSDKTKVIVC